MSDITENSNAPGAAPTIAALTGLVIVGLIGILLVAAIGVWLAYGINYAFAAVAFGISAVLAFRRSFLPALVILVIGVLLCIVNPFALTFGDVRGLMFGGPTS